MRPQGTADELERRRRLALELVDNGEDKHDVARILGVTPRSLNRWIQIRQERGDKGLTACKATGRPPRLTFAQQRQVLGWLTKSPLEFGFATDLWNAPRVAALIRRRWDIAYHPRYVNHWLTCHGISPQRPGRVPRERDEARILRWLACDWPRIKKKPGGNARGSWRSMRPA